MDGVPVRGHGVTGEGFERLRRHGSRLDRGKQHVGFDRGTSAKKMHIGSGSSRDVRTQTTRVIVNDPESRSSLEVSAVARRTGVSVRTLHYNEEIGLVDPSGRTTSGHRRYTPGDMQRPLGTAVQGKKIT